MGETITVVENLDTWQEIIEIGELWDKKEGWNIGIIKMPVI